ncbi:hypothetical protein [Vibrio sp. D431a]|uniref:hypothetical protein n=1 Tax=Vibrio sp. D431a TaxID=2837388 RepID=UPI0025567165|nr:hypothetical protein [Vibrio sp. D431a]MDK9793768.1 hypothetical protein [Vibrio sp. D431a]
MTVSTELYPSEKEASDFVARIGLERAYRLLDKLSRRFDRRYKRACEQCFAPINREWVRSTPFELDLNHRLKLGIQINDDYFTPEAARKRIIARRLAQKEARKLKQQEQQGNQKG